MLKSVLMRFLRGLVAVVVGFAVSFLSTNLGDIVNFFGLPLSVAAIVTSAVTAALLALDKWVRAYREG